jgi:hypothetical protein
MQQERHVRKSFMKMLRRNFAVSGTLEVEQAFIHSLTRVKASWLMGYLHLSTLWV